MILTLHLVSRIIVSGAYLLYYLMSESQIWCVDFFFDGRVVHTILVEYFMSMFPYSLGEQVSPTGKGMLGIAYRKINIYSNFLNK